MGLVYFKRFRMELELDRELFRCPTCPPEYELVPFADDLVRDHASAKYESFRHEMDADVFPCLGQRDGCLQLMKEISRRSNFVAEATWLLRYRHTASGQPEPIGTIQGLDIEEWGAIQNLGISRLHRGRGLGSLLLYHAAQGFIRAGLARMHLEVTTDNTGAVRLYERLGFRRAKVVYKAADMPVA